MAIGVMIAAQPQHQRSTGFAEKRANRIRRRSCDSNGLILLEGFDQIVESLDGREWRAVPASDEQMTRLSRGHGVRSSLRHQAKSRLSVDADLVAQVVRPAAERIDIVEILMQTLGQQQAHHGSFRNDASPASGCTPAIVRDRFRFIARARVRKAVG
jgi:hypothetical protein